VFSGVAGVYLFTASNGHIGVYSFMFGCFFIASNGYNGDYLGRRSALVRAH
jgi:hypothetical protein